MFNVESVNSYTDSQDSLSCKLSPPCSNCGHPLLGEALLITAPDFAEDGGRQHD